MSKAIRKLTGTIPLAFVLLAPVFGQSTSLDELRQTSRILGVAVKDLSQERFHDVNGDNGAPEFRFKLERRTATGALPKPSYETRKVIRATAPDGTVYHAFSGRFEEGSVFSGPGESSTNANARQRYGTHHGYAFNPADVFIGKQEKGKIRTSLFFRDVGSHETAPFHFAFDKLGRANLIVSDVNIFANNELNVYVMVGDPATGRWLEAAMVDRRGFTSISHPWAGGHANSVHLLWNWGDATYDTNNPTMGLFHLDKRPEGFGIKTRVIAGLIEGYDAAVDQQSGRLVVIASRRDGVFAASRSPLGVWSRHGRLAPDLVRGQDVSIESLTGGRFIVRTGAGQEFVITPI